LLAVFTLSAVGVVAALRAGSAPAAIVAVAVMIASFVAGATFAFRLPDMHLNEFRAALRHGEIVLMVDIPRRRVAWIEDVVSRRHPAATAGGAGWTLDAFGI
jgi:CO/xanthine dehydrogenase FAD-binding subunit